MKKFLSLFTFLMLSSICGFAQGQATADTFKAAGIGFDTPQIQFRGPQVATFTFEPGTMTYAGYDLESVEVTYGYYYSDSCSKELKERIVQFKLNFSGYADPDRIRDALKAKYSFLKNIRSSRNLVSDDETLKIFVDRYSIEFMDTRVIPLLKKEAEQIEQNAVKDAMNDL